MDTRCKNRFVATTKEKWDLNQYWYSANTIASLKKEVQEHATKVAFLSTPSVWFSLENSDIKNRSFFFDVDSQWEKHSNFVYWNYNQPSEVDRTMHHQFDCVVIDPPFVTREVWAKYSEAALLLLKEGGKIILSTIPENAEMLKHMLNVKRQAFQPSIPHLVASQSLRSPVVNCMSPPILQNHGVSNSEDARDAMLPLQNDSKRYDQFSQIEQSLPGPLLDILAEMMMLKFIPPVVSALRIFSATATTLRRI
ncbi:uncharacterized protein [Physcomitrium patens]|uniref:uncharacterized protein isoform X2 n=1 Tax=Physcomitrium patens TaxID=3218 RepID=UPI003CCD6085